MITNDVSTAETKFYLNGELVPDTGDHSSQNIVLGGADLQIGATIRPTGGTHASIDTRGHRSPFRLSGGG